MILGGLNIRESRACPERSRTGRRQGFFNWTNRPLAPFALQTELFYLEAFNLVNCLRSMTGKELSSRAHEWLRDAKLLRDAGHLENVVYLCGYAVMRLCGRVRVEGSNVQPSCMGQLSR